LHLLNIHFLAWLVLILLKVIYYGCILNLYHSCLCVFSSHPPSLIPFSLPSHFNQSWFFFNSSNSWIYALILSLELGRLLGIDWISLLSLSRFIISSFLAVIGFDLRASCFLGRHSTIWTSLPARFIISCVNYCN
jgi:hypothetical protein